MVIIFLLIILFIIIVASQKSRKTGTTYINSLTYPTDLCQYIITQNNITQPNILSECVTDLQTWESNWLASYYGM